MTKKTCEDCRYYEQGRCFAPVPMWVKMREPAIYYTFIPITSDATDCESFSPRPVEKK